MQTREDRIYAHYRGLCKMWDWRNSGKPQLFMLMARTWQMPIRDIKDIVDAKGGMP